MKYKVFFFSSGGYDSCKKKFRRSSTRVMLFIRKLKRKLIPKFLKKKMDIFNVIFNGRMRKYRKYVKAVRSYFYKRYKSFR